MTATITVTIANLPKEMNDDFWNEAEKEAVKICGVPVQRSKNIHIDAKLLMEHYPDEFSTLMGVVASCHLVCTADNFFKQ